MIDENKISTLKSEINSLRNVLKKYELDKAKLEAICFKKNSSKGHIHTTHTKHVFHMLIIHIMHSCMVEFIHVLIVTERVT